MTQTSSGPVFRYLGGESGHRSFFGGTHSRARVFLIGTFIVAGLVLTPLMGAPGLVIGVLGCAITFVLTAKTHRGSILERRTKRARWKARVNNGTDAFVPYEVGAWDQLSEAAKNFGNKDEAWKAQRELTAMRAMPDGADGMGWLQYDANMPGIAWHAPTGEEAYLSVAFSVTGQLRGIESESKMSRAAEAWGRFLASRAVPSSLVGDVQTLTRVLPADSALQELWVQSSLDPTAPAEAVNSYAEVLRLTGDGAMVQRHYIIVKWPLTAAFYDAAERYARGRDGWRAVMEQEIRSTVRGLKDARLGDVAALSARQTAAIMKHQQNPTWPIDYVRDIEPGNFGSPSHDEFSAYVVDDLDPIAGVSTQWWHRTAKISAEALATAPRTQLWPLDLLIGSELQFVRSISFHIHLIPAGEAKASARQDLVRDLADKQSKLEAGQLDVDDNGAGITAASRRTQDLASGSHHNGAAWVSFVTISARTRDGLARASRQLEETCSTGLGIERLDWQDSYQSAAAGTTWPIARGTTAGSASFSARVYDRLAGKSEKEALS